MIDRLHAELQEVAAVYNRASKEEHKRRPSTYSYAIDVTSYHLAGAAAGYGWRGCEIGGKDPVRGTWRTPQELFAELDPRLAAILKEQCGIRWDAVSCAEPKAVNNLLQEYPDTDLRNVALVTVWISDGTLADPCEVCRSWVYTYLHSVNGASVMGDITNALGPLSMGGSSGVAL